MAKPRETDLYVPVKTLLEAQGYEVKGEIGDADVMALRGAEDPVIVELKTGFSLALFHQGVERLKVTDLVYIAVPCQTGKAFQRNLKDNTSLCRRLGLGLILVRLRDGFAEVLLDPAPYKPVKSKQRKQRLLREFQRRVGDPNKGGSTRKGLMTAYRQDALRCATYLTENGPSKGAIVAKETGAPTATTIMRNDHYGWFEKVEKGIYALTPKGVEGLAQWGGVAPVQSD
ncbi:DUF2161 domain-containing phosphodiesterase [Halocynthiibacter namhaensis]|uniref:DUF2161 domain-containing phosphodiesterase n=1 Tax=Halocynthiibacter namhaensis TaxID=1290553 RepID=UPI000578EBCD|nr:DUF2161 family putative PD-(D/E)XK-type phosphodiesterase [Halocynthiibacter namhaensis]